MCVESTADERIETVYSFIGEYSPSQDTDCVKQQKINNIHDPAEVYRQSLQNAFVHKSESRDETTAKVVCRCRGVA